MRAENFNDLLARVHACTACAAELPHKPRPVVAAHPGSRILIIGQAPGRKVHESGIPWNDASGARLRDWTGLGEGEFYNPRLVALIPMGFCYPGKGKSGDLAPRRECAPLWHTALLAGMKEIRLTLLVGQYAQRAYLPAGSSLTANVRNFRETLPEIVPLPHPSPRNGHWLAGNPWFVTELLPELRSRVAAALGKINR